MHRIYRNINSDIVQACGFQQTFKIRIILYKTHMYEIYNHEFR